MPTVATAALPISTSSIANPNTTFRPLPVPVTSTTNNSAIPRAVASASQRLAGVTQVWRNEPVAGLEIIAIMKASAIGTMALIRPGSGGGDPSGIRVKMLGTLRSVATIRGSGRVTRELGCDARVFADFGSAHT